MLDPAAELLELGARDREVLRKEYYRVFSADQAGGLSGEIEYSVHEIFPHIWAVRPSSARVVNLLERDAVLASYGVASLTSPEKAAPSIGPGGEELLFSTESGGVRKFAALLYIESAAADERVAITLDGTSFGETGSRYYLPESSLGPSRFLFEWPDGTARNAAMEIRRGINAPVSVDKKEGVRSSKWLVVSGLLPDSSLRWEDQSIKTDNATYIVSDSVGIVMDMTVTGPWMMRDIKMSIPSGLQEEPVVWIDLAQVTSIPAGRIVVKDPDAAVDIFDSGLNLISREVGDVPLLPGLYQLAIRRPNDPYYSQIQDVAVQSMKKSEIHVSNLVSSTRFRLDQAQVALGRTEKKISRSRGFGWTLLAVGASGIAGSLYSFLQVRSATDGYNNATLTSEAQAFRDDITQWGTVLGISAGIGVGSGALGGYFLWRGSGSAGLSRERGELQRKVKELSEQAATEAAANPLFGRSAK